MNRIVVDSDPDDTKALTTEDDAKALHEKLLPKLWLAGESGD